MSLYWKGFPGWVQPSPKISKLTRIAVEKLITVTARILQKGQRWRPWQMILCVTGPDLGERHRILGVHILELEPNYRNML